MSLQPLDTKQMLADVQSLRPVQKGWTAGVQVSVDGLNWHTIFGAAGEQSAYPAEACYFACLACYKRLVVRYRDRGRSRLIVIETSSPKTAAYDRVMSGLKAQLEAARTAAGRSRSSLGKVRYWRAVTGRPTLRTLVAVAESLGYELRVELRPHAEADHARPVR